MNCPPPPPIRVDPALRAAAEAVLEQGESLSSFAEQSLRLHIARRQAHKAFVKRGLAARDGASRSGEYVAADAVLAELDALLANLRQAPP